MITSQLKQYIYLTRLDKPIGIFLLLWPTWWAIWLASDGVPDLKILLIFTLGVIFMRSAGCIMNDIADRNFDRHVKRTSNRPLASNKISVIAALILATILIFFAFLLVLQCNIYTIKLAFVGAALAFFYPFLKRITHLPQLGLGFAFAWGVPMAFAAITNDVDLRAWFLFAVCVIWPIIYDTIYAMVDREDDIKIGVKSTAILFAAMEKLIIALLQFLFSMMLVIIGLMFHLHRAYFYSLLIVVILFMYQQYCIRHRDQKECFRAFLNNNLVGFVIFIGIFVSYLQ